MSIRFPESFDDNDNLFLVHDGLRLRLAEDYSPGDTSITIERNDEIMDLFPSEGIITLTEQCSDIEDRAISFTYTSKGTNNDTFEGLKLLDGFTDTTKSKRITNVVQNVVAPHHNNVKDAIIAIEKFIGIKGDIATKPLQGTLEARINFLRKLVLKPRSWFKSNKRIGIIPLCIQLEDLSTREPDLWVWDFGDGTISTISRTGAVTSGSISKCYLVPGIYDIKLTVSNDFGSDTAIIPEYVTARIESPDEASIEFLPSSTQSLDNGVLRSRINEFIDLLVTDNGEQALDSVVRYKWELGDDLEHESNDSTKALYSIGGVYDVKLRTETELGAYRITTFEDVIDVIEKVNIWHFIFSASESSSSITRTSYAYEFGLISETYKSASTSSALSVTRNDGFLSGVEEEERQKKEFKRNNGFAPRSLTSSGDGGNSLIFWSEGAAADTDSQFIRFRQFNGFDNTWATPVLGGSDTLTRYWNWVPLNSGSNLYIVLGAPGPAPLGVGSATNQTFKDIDLTSLSITDISFSTGDYLNGAEELEENVGEGDSGHFSVYRSAWNDDTGYMVRNDGTGLFFRLKSFYQTEGTISSPLNSIRKLTDLPGSTKFEGQMVSLSTGVYLFNNTGEVLVYTSSDNTWKVAGPGINSPEFGNLQDKDVSDFDDSSNTLIAVSDSDRKAYLFFDYSTRAQLKYNEADSTFTSLPVRPSGDQFLAGAY